MDFVCGAHRIKQKKKLLLKVFLEISQSKNLKVNESNVTQVLR